VAAEVITHPTPLIAVAALVRRHGGLGRLGWLFVAVLAASPLLIFPLGYYGLMLALICYAVAFGLLGLSTALRSCLDRRCSSRSRHRSSTQWLRSW
jgi:hypothetical protein